MQKIMFNDRYRLTQAVIEGRKTVTRRIEGGDKFQEMADNADEIFYNEDDGTLDMQVVGIDIFSYKPHYKVGDVVAVAQSYKSLGYDGENTWVQDGVHYHKDRVAGYGNKMYVKADRMPHRVRITGVRCERLQEISDEECLREGVEGGYIGCYVPGVKCKDWKKESHVDTPDGMTWKLFPNPRSAFAALIDKVSGRGTWERNPWVVVYEFELVK